MGKLSLYFNTVRYMRPGQIFCRLKKLAGLSCPLGVPVPAGTGRVQPLQTVEELDFDPEFLSRFSSGEWMGGTASLLHHAEHFSWEQSWTFPDCTPLWNYNLHYMEYLYALAFSFRETGEEAYLKAIRSAILGWIRCNPRSGAGAGWSAYTVSLRLTVWLELYSLLETEFHADPDFCRSFLESARQQYGFLSGHLEKDILGNHLFENLKTLVLCAVFFGDPAVEKRALALLIRQSREQILPDGMHSERSPMYHKIILEDLIRVCAALRGAGRPCGQLEQYLPAMTDAAYSMEAGLERLPLFNDCGANVSKGLAALLAAVKHHFGITPVFRSCFPDAGYYIRDFDGFRMVIDAGKPGPDHLCGHAHCDCMSFELFQDGKPLLVNCGTYAYQDQKRAFFRSTSAHNTVMSGSTEQSRCWGAFRMARRARVRVQRCSREELLIRMTDQAGHGLSRRICFQEDRIAFTDRGEQIRCYIHSLADSEDFLDTGAALEHAEVPYAAEFGAWVPVRQICLSGGDTLTWAIDLKKFR